MPRKLQLKRRAERQQETRRRIVEATVALHESGGGAAATISAIAERANVERLTVYRHFPDERSLLTACTQHYYEQHPPPDPARWEAVNDLETRLRTALLDIYGYHRRTERMSLRAVYDVLDLPILREVLAPYEQHWRRVRRELAAAWDIRGETPRVVEAAVGHAIAFTTWYSLAREQGLGDAEAAELMTGMLCAGLSASRPSLLHSGGDPVSRGTAGWSGQVPMDDGRIQHSGDAGHPDNPVADDQSHATGF